MYIDQKAVDCLTAERNEILVRDANVQVESSLAIDDVTHSTRSDMLRLSRVPVSSGASMREVLDVLRPFNVTTVYMRALLVLYPPVPAGLKDVYIVRNRNLAYAKFDNQEGADKALAATWSKAGVSLRNNRIYGNYHPSGPPSYPQCESLLHPSCAPAFTLRTKGANLQCNRPSIIHSPHLRMTTGISIARSVCTTRRGLAERSGYSRYKYTHPPFPIKYKTEGRRFLVFIGVTMGFLLLCVFMVKRSALVRTSHNGRLSRGGLSDMPADFNVKQTRKLFIHAI